MQRIAHRCKEKPLDEASEAIMRVRPNPFLGTQGYRFGSLVIVAEFCAGVAVRRHLTGRLRADS
jgi:hypothetical protein